MIAYFIEIVVTCFTTLTTIIYYVLAVFKLLAVIMHFKCHNEVPKEQVASSKSNYENPTIAVRNTLTGQLVYIRPGLTPEIAMKSFK